MALWCTWYVVFCFVYVRAVPPVCINIVLHHLKIICPNIHRAQHRTVRSEVAEMWLKEMPQKGKLFLGMICAE